MGRAASGAARGAARIVTGPLRVAQRSYAVFGRQLYIATTGMMDIVKGTIPAHGFLAFDEVAPTPKSSCKTCMGFAHALGHTYTRIPC